MIVIVAIISIISGNILFKRKSANNLFSAGLDDVLIQFAGYD